MCVYVGWTKYESESEHASFCDFLYSPGASATTDFNRRCHGEQQGVRGGAENGTPILPQVWLPMRLEPAQTYEFVFHGQFSWATTWLFSFRGFEGNL